MGNFVSAENLRILYGQVLNLFFLKIFHCERKLSHIYGHLTQINMVKLEAKLTILLLFPTKCTIIFTLNLNEFLQFSVFYFLVKTSKHTCCNMWMQVNNVWTERETYARPEQIFQFMLLFLWDIIHHSFHPVWHYTIPDLRSDDLIGHQTKQPIQAIF